MTFANAAAQTAVARPMPRPAAQVQPYVDVPGIELTIQFPLQSGGAELCLSADPRRAQRR